MCSEFWQKSRWLQLMTLKIIRDTKSTLLCQTGSLFKNFIPIHSWKFFVRQFFDQFSWFKITIKVSKWHKNGMNSIKMIKSSFTLKWSYKSQWFRNYMKLVLGILNGISLDIDILHKWPRSTDLIEYKIGLYNFRMNISISDHCVIILSLKTKLICLSHL